MSEVGTANYYLVGVDGGGTKCRAVLTDRNNQVLGRGEGGPSNPYQNVARALESIDNAIEQSLRNAGLDASDKGLLVVGMGLAGVNVPAVFQTIAGWNHPYAHTFLTTDLHTACIAAHESIEGAVIIAGTGSCGFAYAGGRSLSLGGHGFPCGDKGGGAWLGLSAVQAALLAEDGLGDATLLSELISDQLQSRGIMIVERLSAARQADYARLAPLVFRAAEQGDAIATAIVREGVAYLSAMARKLLALGPPRISMIGGVSQKILQWMDPELASQFAPPRASPEFGALLFARSELEKLHQQEKS